MRIGIPRESRPGETLVAATAKTASQLAALGYDVVVEQGAGAAADQPDAAYEEAGVRVGRAPRSGRATSWSRSTRPPTTRSAGCVRGATVVALMAPARSPELVERLGAAGVTALAMDAVPRISRAQSMDVLSSMANVAGYRAVIEAAHEFGRLFTGQVTAAGKVPPARVFVVGAGVAGLAAIGAAGSLGAIVRAFDVRPEVAEQVESMGAQFVTVDMEQEVSSDGYAKEMTAEQEAATAAMYDEEARAADIVITTALIPGRPAPLLVTAETVAAMQPGSVVVDMAAANGGNVAATVTDERVVTDNGVTVLGYTDLAGRLAAQTSQLYGTNIVNLLKLLTPEKDGQLTLDMDDVVQRGITVTRDGEVMWPPPPVQVSAAPTGEPHAGDAGREGAADAARPAPQAVRRRAGRRGLPRARDPRAAQLPAEPHRLRARGGHRLLRHRQRAPRAAHAADERHQRDQRDHRGRRDPAGADRQPRGPDASPGWPSCSPASTSSVASSSPGGCSTCSRRAEPVVSFVTGAYILAALLFILALAGLSKHETARRGNAFGMAGMALALVATLLLVLDYLTDDLIVRQAPVVVGLVIILVAGTVGAVIGIRLARGVEMTGMPELIAMMHSFVGLAAVLVGYNTYIEVASPTTSAGADAVHNAEVFLGVFIGAVTFTGSIVANLKLSARMKSAPADAARPPPAQPGDPRRLGRADGLVHARRRLGRDGAAGAHDRRSRWCSASTSSPRSAAATCPSSCRCSTATRAGRPRPPASCSATTC